MGHAHADHPLITDDPHVHGKGRTQLELQFDRARGGSAQMAVELSHGVHEDVDAVVELPYLRERTDEGIVRGAGDASLGLKWRFFEREALALAIKPELILATGRDEAGLGAGRSNWALSLLGAYELGRFELRGELGYARNRNRIAEPESLRHRSAALLWSATDQLRLAVDIVSRTPERKVVYALLYELTDDVELGLGLQRGLNDAADDKAMLVGVRLHW